MLKWCMLAQNSESMGEEDSPASLHPGPASHAIAGREIFPGMRLCSSWTSRKWRQCDCWLLGCMKRITLGCGLSVNAGTVWKCAGGYWSRGSSEACKRGNNAANGSHHIKYSIKYLLT